jgi:hypothetical protein
MAVIRGVEIGDEHARQRFPQRLADDRRASRPLDEEHRQLRVREAPAPHVLVVDSPADLVGVHHRRLAQNLQQLLHDRIELLREPPQVPQHAGAADLQAVEFLEQRRGFPQRNPQMPATVDAQQLRPRPDVRPRHGQVAPPLGRRAARRELANMPAEAMHFDLRFRNAFDEMIGEFPRGLHRLAAGRAGLDEHVVRNHVLGGRLRPRLSGMLAKLDPPPVPLFWRALRRIRLRHKLLSPPPQLGLQLGNPGRLRTDDLLLRSDQRLQPGNPLQ